MEDNELPRRVTTESTFNGTTCSLKQRAGSSDDVLRLYEGDASYLEELELELESPHKIDRTRSDPSLKEHGASDFHRKKNFKKTVNLKPRRPVTTDCKATRNNGRDNAALDLILYAGDTLFTTDKAYRVFELLGQGSFGQVVKCKVEGGSCSGQYVAVKVVKNKPAYYNQALVETRILRLLNQEEEDAEIRRIVELKECFEFRNHLCLVFDLLSINLYELIKENKYRGLSMKFVQSCTRQITDALRVLSDVDVIHCDVKPENILLVGDLGSSRVKLVDFGSSCFRGQTVYTYIQSRFYRAPEIILGLPYGSAIDLWSLGCLAVELFIGLPLFPGVSQHNQLSRITETIGSPPFHLLERGRDSLKFYSKISNDEYELKSPQVWAIEQELPKPEISKRYIREIKLEDIIIKGCNRKECGEEETEGDRRSLLNFVSGLLVLDPAKRWTAWQAFSHPFLCGEELLEPYSPRPDPRVIAEKRKQENTAPKPIPTATGSHGCQSPYGARGGVVDGSMKASPLSPPNRPGHPFPLAYQASWTSGNHMDVRFKPEMYSHLVAPRFYPVWNTPNQQYASCPPNLGHGFYNPYSMLPGAHTGMPPMYPMSQVPVAAPNSFTEGGACFHHAPQQPVYHPPPVNGPMFQQHFVAEESAKRKPQTVSGLSLQVSGLQVNDEEDGNKDEGETALFSLSPDQLK